MNPSKIAQKTGGCLFEEKKYYQYPFLITIIDLEPFLFFITKMIKIILTENT